MESGAIRPPSAAAAAAPPVQLTAEEEAIKRNTDCVYFLASPLTCKKGSECEYRHSEAARMNPRDCYYWLNGNCTNRKCTYRHPPLEGLFGVLPPPPALPLAPGFNPMKQSTPCYYFQKGNCIKGDRCPFMHGPPSSSANAIPQQPAKVSASPSVPSLGTRRTEPLNPSAIAKPAQNPPYNGHNSKATQGNLIPNASKPAVNSKGPNGAVTATTKPRAPITVNNAHHLPNKTAPAVNSSDEDHLKYPHPSSRGIPAHNCEMSDERPQDSREGDEFLGESSPGFDVIVDHDEEDHGYMPPNEEDYRRAFADSYNRAEMYPLDDYELMSRYEREQHGAEHKYEPEFDHEANRFGYMGNDHYDRKRCRRDSSSERALDSRPIGRQSHREEAGIGAETEIIGSDLRHQLMNKQRRLNGSRPRSDVSAEKRDDGHHRQHHRREERHLEEQDRYGSRGMERADPVDRGAVHGRSRLQGRIKMPARPAERPAFMHEDAEIERKRHLRGSARVSPRVSPAPIEFSSRRPHDRMVQQSSSREFVGRLGSRRDEVNFSGPRRLAELKGAKAPDIVSDGGVKESAVDFEGPKPLSEILKRKRGSSVNKSSNDGTSRKGPSTDAAPCEAEVEEGMFSEVNDTNNEVQVTSKMDSTDEKQFEGDQEEPDSNYYEGEEGEEYQVEDENAYQEEGEANEYPEGEEDFEDDDEQAFARKVGVVLS